RSPQGWPPRSPSRPTPAPPVSTRRPPPQTGRAPRRRAARARATAHPDRGAEQGSPSAPEDTSVACEQPLDQGGIVGEHARRRKPAQELPPSVVPSERLREQGPRVLDVAGGCHGDS